MKEGTADTPSASSAPPTVTAMAMNPLPAGWFEAIDVTYNHPYWYNPSTGERTWERPKV